MLVRPCASRDPEQHKSGEHRLPAGPFRQLAEMFCRNQGTLTSPVSLGDYYGRGAGVGRGEDGVGTGVI